METTNEKKLVDAVMAATEAKASGDTVPETSKTSNGRNDPCPCGSGKKYKNCCKGKNPEFSTGFFANLYDSYLEVVAPKIPELGIGGVFGIRHIHAGASWLKAYASRVSVAKEDATIERAKVAVRNKGKVEESLTFAQVKKYAKLGFAGVVKGVGYAVQGVDILLSAPVILAKKVWDLAKRIGSWIGGLFGSEKTADAAAQQA